MIFVTGQITLDVPTELNASRLWWLLSTMSGDDVDYVLEFAEKVASSHSENELEFDEIGTPIDAANS